MSFVFQFLHSSRADAIARQERLRERRIEVYSRFAGVLMEWRRSQVIRSSIPLQETGLGPEDIESVKNDNRRARATAWAAFYEVKLLADDAALEGLAKSALSATREMKRAKGRHAINVAGDEVRTRVEAFLVQASHQVIQD